jgi:antibiotic biosynthesis monooxygenase (ABM) superfamily enzyme
VTEPAPEPRTYTGWKAGLLVVFAVVALISGLNLLAEAFRDNTPKFPGKVVTTVTPSGS